MGDTTTLVSSSIDAKAPGRLSAAIRRLTVADMERIAGAAGMPVSDLLAALLR